MSPMYGSRIAFPFRHGSETTLEIADRIYVHHFLWQSIVHMHKIENRAFIQTPLVCALCPIGLQLLVVPRMSMRGSSKKYNDCRMTLLQDPFVKEP